MADTATQPDPMGETAPPEPAPAATASPDAGTAPAESKPGATGEPEKPKSIGRTAKDYLIPMSDAAKEGWRGKEAAFEQYAIEVAKGLYPTLAPQLDAGVTTKTLVDPYVQVAKSILGEQTEPDFTDPKWSPALDGGMDPATKRPTLMTLTAWRQHLMDDPQHGYDQTPDAHAKALGFVNDLRQHFSSRPG